MLIFLTAGRVSVERSSAAESCWYSPLLDLHAAAACREYAYVATRHVDFHGLLIAKYTGIGSKPKCYVIPGEQQRSANGPFAPGPTIPPARMRLGPPQAHAGV